MTGPVSSNCVRTGRTRCCCTARPASANCKFAQHLAQGLLCEAPQASGEPCGQCAACRWFTQGNHPDYRAVVPEALAGLVGVSDPGSTDEKADADEGKKTRVPSKEIKIEQVRALLDFCGVGSHRGGLRVVLLYPAEALNVAASNALLKTLEEPPSGVVFLMVSARVDRLAADDHQPLPPMADDAPAAWERNCVAGSAGRRRSGRAARRSGRRAAHRAGARLR